MKTTLQTFLMLGALAGLISCESLKSVADVEFDTTMATDLDIAVEQPALKAGLAGFSYSAEAAIDPTSDPEVEKYADKIKKYEVTSLKVTVTAVSEADVTLMQGTWFMISDASNSAKWILPADFDVTVGNSYTLGNENGQWDNVQQILGRNAEFKVASQGSANKNNITIKLETSIGAKVTANPL